MLVPLREILCAYVFGGHIVPPPLNLGYSQKSKQDEFIIHCLRCGKVHMLDQKALTKLFERRKIDGKSGEK